MTFFIPLKGTEPDEARSGFKLYESGKNWTYT